MQNWLQKRVALTPTRTALRFNGVSLTFQELNTAVLTLAGKLARVLDDNPRVAVLTPNTLLGYEMILALQQLGREIVLLNYRLSPDELAFQIHDAGLTQVVQSDAYTGRLDAIQQVTFEQVQAQAPQGFEPVSEFALDQVTTIMYTSGTTGKPKGVEQTFGNHFYSAVGSMLNLGLTASDVWIAAVPIFHISGFSIMMRSLIYGITVQLYERFDAGKINRDIMTGDITTISVVPTMLKDLLQTLPAGQQYPDNFRTMLLGGGPADLATLRQAQAANVEVVQSYGMTETASQIIALDPADAIAKMGSVGKPLFPVELKLAYPNDRGIGRVQVKSPTLTVGYLNQPEKFAASFEEGWFDTGDMGYLDDDGYLYLVGREGDMISSGGENIFPDEVESMYREMPGIKEIGVVGIPDEKWGSVPVAFVDVEPGVNVSAADLITYGREHIAHYKVPKAFYRLTQAWPRTASGKLQRYQLQQFIENDGKIR
ncbi:o-succinylbenzoate--CoA ligase [Weissella viridescens]|uniref:2-succinylbenzoate--CoA ligase n=1 Tax=Weissella viridescens TaxID=1629 RepID=A0A3P2RGM7_WEIVI|nr:o-succinylbenzoate--CoA ligase [Weissella viridescens]RRG18481.1 o-succinylbenzoate--CoA ligase [Weissella viridescens]